MSAVSGLNAKAEKGRSKYVALDINSIYKGKSLENPKATVQPKHGLQSLGKVGTGRRMPPPANLPSLKSENSGNNPNISLVPSGGQGWGSTTKEKGKSEETNGSQLPSPQSQPASSLSQTTQKTSTTNTVATSGVNKTWSSITQSQEDGGQERSFLAQQSPFFPQEFPKLAGGDAPTEGNQKSSVDSQYGPGPSLRPQTEGSWGRGTLQQPPAGSAGNQQPNSGNGVNGPQQSPDTQALSSQSHLRDQRQYPASRGTPIPGSNMGNVPSGSPGGPPMGPVPSPGHSMGGQMGMPPQFRGMMPTFMLGRNSYPSGYPSNFSNVPSTTQQNSRPPYPYSENRRPQPVRPLGEEEAYQRPAAIITEKALKGFDEILQNDTQDTWATSHGEIDYNAKLVFSDDEEAPISQKKEKRDADEKSAKTHNVKSDKDRERKSDRISSDRDNRQLRDSDWSRENRSDKKSEPDNDWNSERGESFDKDRDERWKSWNQSSQGRSPSMNNIEMQRQWQPNQPPQRPFDYRGPPPQPPGSAYASPHARLAAGPAPHMQHGSYPPPPRASRPGPRSSAADDDELWRQRRKQHTEEMTMTVERARQRRAEEEKHYEQSKQSAQEKAKSFEKCDKEKELDLDETDRSRHSSESREDKPPSRDGRERDRSQPNYQGYNFSRQFQKNVPPRFQKQAAEYMRQQQTQQPPMSAGQGGPGHFVRSQSVGQTSPNSGSLQSVGGTTTSHSTQSQPPIPLSAFESGWASHPPYANQIPGMPSPNLKGIQRHRSNSQGSASDSYESDSCATEQAGGLEREPYENYWNRDRRQANIGYENWNSPPTSNEAYFDKESNKTFDQRHDFKRAGLEKEEKTFDVHIRDAPGRREKEFESQDFRYKNRESFKEKQGQSEGRENKEKSKSSMWASAHEYEDRDPFDEPRESNREKSSKDRSERYDRQEKDRWEKERPPRPDSRDSRNSRDSIKDDKYPSDRNEFTVSLDRERKGSNGREEKKEKSSIDWGETPYPVENKRREWYHHPPPITPKQIESIGPPKKNLTTLRRSNAANTPTISEKKTESLPKSDSSTKKTESDLSLKKDKDIKEEKNEKIKIETVAKDNEKHGDSKFDQSQYEKSKNYSKEISKKSDSDSISEAPKKDSPSVDEKDKSRTEKYDQSSRNDLNRDRRQNRERGLNSRSRGNTAISNNPLGVNTSGGGRYDNSRSRGGNNNNNNRSGGYSTAPTQSSSSHTSGSTAFRGKREYRRSRVERGPRFERQKERDKVKDDKKEKHSDDTSCSEIEESKLGHLRSKDEDSEVSVDEASASTTESAQAEKYQGSDVLVEEKNYINDSSNMVKDTNIKNDKYKKEKSNQRIDPKPYELEKKEEKGGFAPRGEPTRRGRGTGTLSFRRGGVRHGPSSYGPPPSRAGFGSNKPEKLEDQKIIEENYNDSNQLDFKSGSATVDNISNAYSKDSNKSRSLERPQQRRPGRFEQLPPRFQRKHDRRYDKFDPSSRGRGRGRSSGFQGSGGQMSKMTQGGKENLSDVGNEEWETASESSDVADRHERSDIKDEARKKDFVHKGLSASKKSFSSQRPINEGVQGRRMNDNRRGGPNSGDRNRPRDTLPRDNRSRDSMRGRQNSNFVSSGNDRRPITSNGNNSRPSSSAGHPGNVNRNNNGRTGNPSSKSGPFQPKNEGTTAVYMVDEIKLQDPNGVQAALTDLTNRKGIKTEVAVSKLPKSDKDKTCGLEGYDLNNYASVVIIDDYPEVNDDPNVLCGTDDGFQEVTSKKRHKVMIENEVKKMKKEPLIRNKSGSRSRQSKLPPRFAKQRENITKSTSVTTAWDINIDLSPKTAVSAKDSSPAPPTMNAWEKPINHVLGSQPSINTSNPPSCINTTITTVSSCTSVGSSEIQNLAATSKSSSFDRSDQHDSGIDVSDQHASAASSQRSSPSNDCKIVAPTSSGKKDSTEATEMVSEIDTCKPMCTVVCENKNFKAENAVLDKFGGQTKNQQSKDVSSNPIENLVPIRSSTTKVKETSESEDKPISLPPVSFPAKESFSKNEGTEIKLDFSFESGLELADEKNIRNVTVPAHLPNKSLNMGRSMEVSNNGASGIQSPISPSTDDLNLKIQSVKKVWENDPPLPTVMEHPQTTTEESTPTSYGSFSNNAEPSTSVYSTSVDSNSQTRKEQDVSEINFRESSPLQQVCNNTLSKNLDHCIPSAKTHMQMAAQHNAIAATHCPAPLSPPLMSGSMETIAGIRTIAGLASSVQVAGIPAIPSPPTVVFNSSQQLAQTGMYQPLQMDNRQNPAAVAAAAAMVQYSQSTHGYPLGTYGISHQPPNPQLSNAYGQQSLFVQPPATHQGQDMYSSNQYRVQPPYPQSQHVSSNQVLNAQQNLANSHLLGSQLVQTRPTAGPSPAAPHLQSLHSLQAVQPTQASYFSASAQPQAANYYHQPPATPGSPMQQQPQYPSHQSYGSQSTLNVLPQTAAVNPTFRNFGNHQYKAPNNVINNIVPDASTLRSATRSPTVDVSSNRSMFNVSTAVSTSLNSSTPVAAVPPMSSTGIVGKIGQAQGSALPANRINATSAKTSHYSIPLSQQHFYSFGQQKFNHVQPNSVRPQVLFPTNVVRNPTHQQLPTVAAAGNVHYPAPIQRPGPAAAVTQAVPQPQPKIGIRPQANILVPAGKLSSAQQAKLRAEAVHQTHMFFAQSKTGKHEEAVSHILSQENNMQACSIQSVTASIQGIEDEKEKQCLIATDTSTSGEKQDSNEGGEINAGEE